MLRKLKILLLSLSCLPAVAAMGFEPMTATIRVSNGSLYDYVVIGEHPKATDGFDNAYDTISPGNLNADMGQPFISVIIPHPDWKPAMRELRGDIRSPAKKQEWQLSITSSLPAGTPLSIVLQRDQSSLPKGMKLTLREPATSNETDLTAGSFNVPAPGAGKKSELTIIGLHP